MEVYNKVLRLDTANSAAFTGQGIIFYAQEKYDQAVDCFTKALELVKSFDLYAKRAGCYLQFENFDKAIEDCKHARELLASDPQANKSNLEALYLVSAQAFYHKRLFKEAAEDFEQFVTAAQRTYDLSRHKAKSPEWVGAQREQLYSAQLHCSDCYQQLHLQQLAPDKNKPPQVAMPTTELKQRDVIAALDKLKTSAQTVANAPYLKRSVSHCIAASSNRGLDFSIYLTVLTLQQLVTQASSQTRDTQQDTVKGPEDDLFAVLPK